MDQFEIITRACLLLWQSFIAPDAHISGCISPDPCGHIACFTSWGKRIMEAGMFGTPTLVQIIFVTFAISQAYSTPQRIWGQGWKDVCWQQIHQSLFVCL